MLAAQAGSAPPSPQPPTTAAAASEQHQQQQQQQQQPLRMDAASKQPREQSPHRRLLGQSSLQQRGSNSLEQAGLPRSSSTSPIRRHAVSRGGEASGSSPRFSGASPLARAAAAVADSGFASWIKRTPSPAPETGRAAGQAASPTVALTASGTAADQAPPGADDAAAADDAGAVALASAAGGSLHLAGKRKLLEGANSTELQYNAHAKSPQHVYDDEAAPGQQQQAQAQARAQAQVQQQTQGQAQEQQEQQQEAQQQEKFFDARDDVRPMDRDQQQHGQQLEQQQTPSPQAAAQQQHSPFVSHGRSPHQQQQAQQQQQQGGATGQQQQQSPHAPPQQRQGSGSPGLSSGSGGDMRPPSLVDMARRVLGRRPDLFGPPAGEAGAGAAAAAPAASHDTSMATASADGEGGAAGSGLYSEPSLNMALNKTLSGAASLECWLGPGSRTTSGSPRSMSIAAERQHLLRTGSSMSTGSAGQPAASAAPHRQGSLVFGAAAGATPLSRGSSLDKQASFAGWPAAAAAAAAAGGGGGGAGAPPSGWSFPLRTVSEDSLKLDIQMMPAVVPEDYPADAAPAEQDGALQQQQDEQQQQHNPQQQHDQQQQQHVDRAFFAKVAAWEAELVGMLEGQAAPVAIRNIVAVFKDRIQGERDKAEFKALCDKWTGVVEYPAGSGVKCLAIKSWMRGTKVAHPNPAHDDDSEGDWDD